MSKERVRNLIISVIVSVAFYFLIEGPGGVTIFIYGLFMMFGLENSNIGTELMYAAYILLSLLVFLFIFRFLNGRYPSSESSETNN